MQPAAPALYRPGGDVGAFVSTWIKIWAGLLGVVTLVAVIYLIAITQTLRNINGNLAIAKTAVVEVGGETKTLPRQVDNVNTSLKDIDDDVKPIQFDTQRIRAHLVSIQGKLVNVDRSLVTTSGTLTGVQGGAADARNTLVAAQSAGSGGTNLIWRQVGGSEGSLPAGETLNGRLDLISGDADNALGHLRRANFDLLRLCNRLTSALPGGPSSC